MSDFKPGDRVTFRDSELDDAPPVACIVREVFEANSDNPDTFDYAVVDAVSGRYVATAWIDELSAT